MSITGKGKDWANKVKNQTQERLEEMSEGIAEELIQIDASEDEKKEAAGLEEFEEGVKKLEEMKSGEKIVEYCRDAEKVLQIGVEAINRQLFSLRKLYKETENLKGRDSRASQNMRRKKLNKLEAGAEACEEFAVLGVETATQFINIANALEESLTEDEKKKLAEDDISIERLRERAYELEAEMEELRQKIAEVTGNYDDVDLDLDI